MKILVTGGLGFIGINFIKFILKKNIEVINIDKITYASNREKKYLKSSKNYKFYKVDITNYKKMNYIIKKNLPDIIINFAAETHVDRSINKANQFVKTNILGVHSILECCKNMLNIKKIKLIQISTDEVYGSLYYSGSFKEGDVYKPNSPYSASKASADHLIRAYRKTYGVPSIIIHPSNNFGPYQNPEKLIPKIIINCMSKSSIPVYGKGLQIRDWLYVKDTANAIHKIMIKGKVGESYNISTKNELQNLKLVKKIFKYFDKKYNSNKKIKYENLIKFVPDRPGHDFRYSLINKKIKKLGWKYSNKFELKLIETIEWYIKKYNSKLI